VKPTTVSAFGGRLIEAFKGIGIDDLTGIARKLGVQNSAITHYVKGRIPPPKVLTKISDYTNCSIHWLVTGKGPKFTDERALISMLRDEDDRWLVLSDAEVHGKSPADMFDVIMTLGSFAWTTQKAHGIDAIAVLEELAKGHEPMPIFLNKEIGDGEVQIYFGPKEHEIIQKLAGESKRTFEDEVRELLLERLEEKGLVTTKTGESSLIFFGDTVPKMIELPFLGEIAAGEPLLIFPRQEKVSVPDFGRKANKKYMVLHVRGDSMIDDNIPDGSLIVCEAASTANAGQTVVAVIDGEAATVKKYFPERGRIRLQPSNPAHLPQYVSDDRLKIQGIVVVIFHKPS
jgi:repressor LexA